MSDIPTTKDLQDALEAAKAKLAEQEKTYRVVDDRLLERIRNLEKLLEDTNDPAI